jgi:hypothetical protein
VLRIASTAYGPKSFPELEYAMTQDPLVIEVVKMVEASAGVRARRLAKMQWGELATGAVGGKSRSSRTRGADASPSASNAEDAMAAALEGSQHKGEGLPAVSATDVALSSVLETPHAGSEGGDGSVSPMVDDQEGWMEGE